METVREYLAKIGRKGGKASRRSLTTEQARNMVRVREARKLFKMYYARCFWSFDPHYRIELKDLPWVVRQLRINGDRKLWELASKLCQ